MYDLINLVNSLDVWFGNLSLREYEAYNCAQKNSMELTKFWLGKAV